MPQGGNSASLSVIVVQEFEVKGGKVTVPVGCNGLEDWLLDNVDVQKLLPLLRQGMYSILELPASHQRLCADQHSGYIQVLAQKSMYCKSASRKAPKQRRPKLQSKHTIPLMNPRMLYPFLWMSLWLGGLAGLALTHHKALTRQMTLSLSMSMNQS